MNESTLFDYDRFLSSTGSGLIHYVEPFLTTHPDAIPESVYEPLLARLASFDEEHTVYALEIGMLLKPREFIGFAADFLSNSEASVCCAAFRLIKAVIPALSTPRLAGKIAATPKVDLFTTDLRTGDRIRVGTNETFLRELAESPHLSMR